MKFLLSFAIILCSVNFSFADGQIRKVVNPVEVNKEIFFTKIEGVPKEIEGLQWNRWTSKNFVVLALHDGYAQYLNKHLESVKTWTVARWGLSDAQFSSPCKIICVDDPILFDKLFKLKKTRVEIRRDDAGQIKETIIFLLADTLPSHSVPIPLTEVCLAEFSQTYNTKFGWWSQRGMSLLNGSLDQIREQIASIKKPFDANTPLYFSKSLFSLSREEYYKLPDQQKKLFDSAAVLFCLLARKEFGQEKFHYLIKEIPLNPEAALAKVTGFASYDDFDKTFKRYMFDLSNDIINNKTPDRYLQIYEPERN